MVDGTQVIEEVKGRITDLDIAKREATSAWCKGRDIVFRFVTQSELNVNGGYRRFLKENKQ